MAKLKPGGKTPAVIMINPKFAHNVGAVLRACSCFGVRQLWYTGDRIEGDLALRGRLPREERMKGYKDVDLVACDYPFERFPKGTPFIAIEVRQNSEYLDHFEHPEDSVYVFGPEDGSLPQVVASMCHRFVIIRSAHCLNLACAANIVLFDRTVKRSFLGLPQEFVEGVEQRGFVGTDGEVAA